MSPVLRIKAVSDTFVLIHVVCYLVKLMVNFADQR